MEDTQLIELMEDLPVGLHVEVPGLVYQLNIESVRAFKSDVVPNPYANMMGLAKISEGDFDRVVDAVFAAYAGAPFGWVVGPLSQPQDLGQRLLARGLVLAEEMLGMVLDDLATPIPENDNVVIRRLTPEEVPDYADGLARAYGMGITGDAIKVVALGSRGDLFIVQPQGSDEVIGFSRMAYVTDDVVLLGGSAVSEAWRGRGIYKTLVAARLRLARQAGAKKALVQAVEDTSAPICRLMGFRELSKYAFYLGNAK